MNTKQTVILVCILIFCGLIPVFSGMPHKGVKPQTLPIPVTATDTTPHPSLIPVPDVFEEVIVEEIQMPDPEDVSLIDEEIILPTDKALPDKQPVATADKTQQ
ncbi:MAG: hypothetical protein ACI4QM_01450 [Alphaproteobacteria bacterium]